MKPKIFFITFALAAWAFLGANVAQAQPPAPAPPPLAPLTNVVRGSVGDFSGWCGQDFILWHFYWNSVEIRMDVAWFHNDPSDRVSRAFGYALHDGNYKLKISVVTPLVGPGERVTPITFMEEPVGFWRTYVHRTGFSVKTAGYGLDTAVVVVLFRQRDRVCLLQGAFPVGGKG